MEQLESKFVIALSKAISDQPQIGWQRATGELSKQAITEIDAERKMKEHYQDLYFSTSNKLSAYENLGITELEIRVQPRNGPFSLKLTGTDIIREFVSNLGESLTEDDIASGLKELINHRYEEPLETIEVSSIKRITLFLEVLEIAKKSDNEKLLQIVPDKKWLLKAAFLPLAQVLQEEEIPF